MFNNPHYPKRPQIDEECQQLVEQQDMLSAPASLLTVEKIEDTFMANNKDSVAKYAAKVQNNTSAPQCK